MLLRSFEKLVPVMPDICFDSADSDRKNASATCESVSFSDEWA